MRFFSNIWCFISKEEFALAFWSSVLSSILVAILVWLFVRFFTNLITPPPNITFVVKQGAFYSDTIKLSKMDNGDYEASFRLSIKNSGNKTFKANEGYWHVYFENSNEISYIGGAESFTTYGEKTHQRDIINLPIYPGSFLDIGPEYKYIFKKVGEGPGNLNPKPIRYFFETDYGYFPKSVKMDPKTGAVLYNNMGSIFFEMP